MAQPTATIPAKRSRRKRPAGLLPVTPPPTAKKPASQTQTTGYQPRYPKTRPPRKPFDQMDRDEALAFLKAEQAWLADKQIREQSYLLRRQGSNVYTPTDQAYEEDQYHEDDLRAFLQHLIDQA